MNPERFHSALDRISDDFIDAAAGAYEKKTRKRKTIIRGLCAACIGLVLVAVGLLQHGPVNAPDPTQGTISMQSPATVPTAPTTEPINQTESEQEGTKILFLSSENGEETKTPLEIGIATPIDYIVYVRDLRGLGGEERSETIAQWHALEKDIKNSGHGYTWTSTINQDMIVGTYMKGFLYITPGRSEIKHITVDTTNEGVGNHGGGHLGEDYHVSWYINPQILFKDPSIPLSSVHDSLEVTITYKDRTTEMIIIEISLNDDGQVFATLVKDLTTV